MATQHKISQHKYSIFLIIILILVVVGFITDCSNRESKFEQYKTNHNFQLTKTRNKLGQEIARANVYVGTIKDLRNDSAQQLKELQAIEKEYKKKLKSATYMLIEAKESLSGKPVVESKDTVKKDGIVYVYPVYKDTIKTPFSEYAMYMNKDSSNIVAKLTIPLSIAQVMDGSRPKWYMPKDLIITTKLTNPATQVNKLTAFTLSSPKNNTGLKITIGFGIGAASTIFLINKFK